MQVQKWPKGTALFDLQFFQLLPWAYGAGNNYKTQFVFWAVQSNNTSYVPESWIASQKKKSLSIFFWEKKAWMKHWASKISSNRKFWLICHYYIQFYVCLKNIPLGSFFF